MPSKLLAFQRHYFEPDYQPEQRIGDRSMTYVAAFKCAEGVVMCADTLETRGDTKDYVEKLEIPDEKGCALAIGGAGVEDIIRPFTQELIDRFSSSRPANKKELKATIQATIAEIFTKDVPFLVLKRQHLTPQFLIAAKAGDGQFYIFPVIGRRLYKEQSRAIIGYPTAYNSVHMRRFHYDSMSMSQAVLLATFLVAQSKKHDEGVGGETSIVVVTQTGAYTERSEDVKSDEKRFSEFLDIVDRLVLTAPDMRLTEVQFDKTLDEFRGDVRRLRDDYKRELLHRTFFKMREGGEPYTNVPLGIALGFDTEEDLKSANPERMKIMEPDWYEAKKKLHGPVLWFFTRQEISKLAAAATTPQEWIIDIQVEDWNTQIYRANDATKRTILACNQETFEIECRGPRLSVDYKLVVRIQDDALPPAANSPIVEYQEDGVSRSPFEIAKRAVESITQLISQTSADQP